jgi:hypothetical protein
MDKKRKINKKFNHFFIKIVRKREKNSNLNQNSQTFNCGQIKYVFGKFWVECVLLRKNRQHNDGYYPYESK